MHGSALFECRQPRACRIRAGRCSRPMHATPPMAWCSSGDVGAKVLSNTRQNQAPGDVAAGVQATAVGAGDTAATAPSNDRSAAASLGARMPALGRVRLLTSDRTWVGHCHGLLCGVELGEPSGKTRPIAEYGRLKSRHPHQGDRIPVMSMSTPAGGFRCGRYRWPPPLQTGSSAHHALRVRITLV